MEWKIFIESYGEDVHIDDCKEICKCLPGIESYFQKNESVTEFREYTGGFRVHDWADLYQITVMYTVEIESGSATIKI